MSQHAPLPAPGHPTARDGADRSTALVTTRAELTARRVAMTGTVAAVLTMGSLHDGHLALVARARELADHVILTDFVNPLQFGPGEDYEAYPRDLDADLALVEGLVDVVFAPAVQEMYPVLPPTVSVSAGRAGTLLEGAARPGHFDGVVTVVTKLLHLTAPHLSVFGRKDAQQLAIIQRLVADLDLPVRIEPVEIQREPSGLARSSRNAYLSPAGREQALALSRTIQAALAAAPSVRGIRAALADALERAEIDWDYAHALDPATLAPIDGEHRGEVLVALAGVVEGTRLLDAAVAVATAP
ncbi:pantoate--beta-alanine ligase [Brachybacterium saurashtrense]|uniref:Pantothenate synthetase n=1 Tax=Brachybacterium saurashtrense TaxID=556288 RepID=A0A345YLM0_9MICO|nr:pantoate--beta-alanine ligase [Brachybacterium saurashtrense]AXK44822.1 pantoate--beta-alanine ligase [Brachybacterium saurashtrense]RRR20798.1 pantoate--beta-alanine ligase [Brachybacterium saurashtrense]